MNSVNAASNVDSQAGSSRQRPLIPAAGQTRAAYGNKHDHGPMR